MRFGGESAPCGERLMLQNEGRHFITHVARKGDYLMPSLSSQRRTSCRPLPLHRSMTVSKREGGNQFGVSHWRIVIRTCIAFILQSELVLSNKVWGAPSLLAARGQPQNAKGNNVMDSVFPIPSTAN